MTCLVFMHINVLTMGPLDTLFYVPSWTQSEGGSTIRNVTSMWQDKWWAWKTRKSCTGFYSLLPAIYWVKTNYKANLASRGWASVIVPCAYKQKNWNICDYLWWLQQRKENRILIGRWGRELHGGGDSWVWSLLMSIILASEIEVTWWHSHIMGNNPKFENKGT